MYKLILTSNGSKKAWPPQKIPRNDEYVYIINMHVCNTKNSLKYKKRRIRRRRIAPTKEKPKNQGVRSHRHIILTQKYCGKDQRSCDGRGQGTSYFIAWSSGVNKAFDVGGPNRIDFIYFWGSNEKQQSCDGQGGGAQRPVWGGNKLKKTGARTRGPNPLVYHIFIQDPLSVILSVILSSCHIPVVFLSSCHSCGTLRYSL